MRSFLSVIHPAYAPNAGWVAGSVHPSERSNKPGDAGTKQRGTAGTDRKRPSEPQGKPGDRADMQSGDPGLADIRDPKSAGAE
jgi:hypothetical protein